jgi:hypothetical protein
LPQTLRWFASTTFGRINSKFLPSRQEEAGAKLGAFVYLSFEHSFTRGAAAARRGE